MSIAWEDKDDPTQEDWDRWDSLSNGKVLAEFTSLGCIIFERYNAATLKRVCDSMVNLAYNMEKTKSEIN